MRWAAIACVLVACDFHDAISDGGGDGSGDGSGSGGATCAGKDAFQICASGTPMPMLMLSGDLDTDSDARCSLGAWMSTDVLPGCIVVAEQVTISDLTVHGSLHVFAVVGLQSITVTGAIDASSHLGSPSVFGPGSQLATNPCTPFTRTPAGKGGGAGGTFMTPGGSGGGAAADAGGIPPPPDAFGPNHLRAGCPGQNAAGGALGGVGGGGILLASNGTITFMANTYIDASGSAGR